MFPNARPVRLILWWLLCACMVPGLYAQTGKVRISGIISDSLTGEALPLVGITLAGTSYGVNSNLDGEFALYVPPGNYLVSVRYSGYRPFEDSITVGDQGLDGLQVRLKPVSTEIETVVITGRAVNPAHRVIRECNRHRAQNRFSKIDAYEYEAYTKLVITMDNVTDRFLDNKLIKGVGKEVKAMLGDSAHTDTSKYKLAVFVSEGVSKIYSQRPDLKKEEILAVKSSGIQGSEYNLLSTMFLQIDVYDNTIVILDKNFISPLADGSLVDYDYQLLSTEIDGRDTLFGIQIIPRTAFSPTFKGTVYIDSRDWAINRIDLQMNTNPNINFVEDVRIRQEYTRLDTTWVPSLMDLEVNFQNSIVKRQGGDGPGLIGRTSSYMYDYVLNQPRDPKFFQKEILEIKAGAQGQDSLFWAEKRRSPLDKSEMLGYSIVDSLKSRGILDFYVDAITFITWGTQKFKYFEVGPYFYLLGFNQAEGWRTRCGLYTTKAFSKRLYLGGHLAYGFADHRLKYLAEAKYRLRVNPKLEIGVRKTHEVEQVGFENFLNNGTSLLQTSLRRVPLTQLNYFDENRLFLNADIRKGLSGEFYVRTKYFEPTRTFPFAFDIGPDGPQSTYTVMETGADLRISFKEKYITSGGDRMYIGTKYPIFTLSMAHGYLGLQPTPASAYQSVSLKAANWVRLGRYGWLRYNLRAGQVFGTLPYPSLHVFRGNQSFGYDREGFNMMNYYEFVADRYATVCLEQHFEGLFWNKLPLLRKLKWKELLTARMAWGTLSEPNRVANLADIPWGDGLYLQRLQAPTRVPYLEAGVGLENIFKFLQVHGIWRLNYHENILEPGGSPNPLHRNWGHLNNFGLRFELKVAF